VRIGANVLTQRSRRLSGFAVYAAVTDLPRVLGTCRSSKRLRYPWFESVSLQRRVSASFKEARRYFSSRIYTGVTRGKRLVVLVGQRKALAIAVKGAQTRRRWSKLREWLACQ